MLLRRATATLLAVPLLLVTGCGDVQRLQPNKDVATPVALDKPRATINPGPTSPPPTTAAPTSAAPPATGTGQPTGALGDGTEVKGTIGNTFEPATLEIKAGDTVTWTLDGAHSVTGGTDGTGKPDPASPMKSEIGVPTYKATFDQPGTYPYYCFPHFSVGMKGEIVVK